MSLPADAVTALETFQAAAGWEQRARLLMQWGERLPALSDADKVDANRVHGCESQVWLVGALQRRSLAVCREQRCAVDSRVGGVAAGAGQWVVGG